MRFQGFQRSKSQLLHKIIVKHNANEITEKNKQQKKNQKNFHLRNIILYSREMESDYDFFYLYLNQLFILLAKYQFMNKIGYTFDFLISVE